MNSPRKKISRRNFCSNLLFATGGLAATGAFAAPAIVTSPQLRPEIQFGVGSGDVTAHSAVIWSRSSRPATMRVEVDTSDSFKRPSKYRGPVARLETDFVSKLLIRGLRPGQEYFYRVIFEDLSNSKISSTPAFGSFRTAPVRTSNVSFAWSGDTAGQGFGIDVERGGMKTYDSITKLRPHFFVHSGDTIYADNPMEPEMKLDDGTVWKNLMVPEKAKVAETLDEFRGNHRYNMLDKNVLEFNSRIPVVAQWDDHEVLNNWYWEKSLQDDKRYVVKDMRKLVKAARQAFFEYLPISPASNTIYRHIPYGPLLDVFIIDLRSFRGPNSFNRQTSQSWQTDYLGSEQLNWLKRALLNSRGLWKVICSDMPLGLIIADGKSAYENGSNGNGSPLGREIEIADLLFFMWLRRIQNTVWLTADVHYAASHYYSPNNAVFQRFLPFWEFVSGPLHAGSFGPNALDNTFGPEVIYSSVPPKFKGNRPPSDGHQFFGMVNIEGASGVMNVAHHERDGKKLWNTNLYPKV